MMMKIRLIGHSALIVCFLLSGLLSLHRCRKELHQINLPHHRISVVHGSLHSKELRGCLIKEAAVDSAVSP